MIEARTGLTPGEIVFKVRKSFQREVDRSPNQVLGFMFTTFRGLNSYDIFFPDGNKLWVEGYLDVLPKFHDKDFVQLVDEEIGRREQQARSNGKPFEKAVIVDIGYGKGFFLSDCRKKWQEKVVLVGLGTDLYTKTTTGVKGLAQIPPTEQKLQEDGVRLINGNVIDIRKLLGDNFADFVVESKTLMHVSYPSWEMVKKVYRTLKPRGIALLDLNPGAHMIPLAVDYLNKNGYDFEATEGVAFRKTQPDISVPVRTVNLGGYPNSLIFPDS